MQQPISIVKGTSKTFSLTIVDSSGQQYTLHSGEVLRFGVKTHPGSPVYLIEKEVSSGQDGQYFFSFVPSDTENFGYDKYFYDIGLQRDTDYFNIIECSPFNITYNITEIE